MERPLWMYRVPRIVCFGRQRFKECLWVGSMDKDGHTQFTCSLQIGSGVVHRWEEADLGVFIFNCQMSPRAFDTFNIAPMAWAFVPELLVHQS